MKTPGIITDNTEIARIINTLYPNARDIRHIEHGSENHIVIVDNRYVVRFPRNERVCERMKLERFVLSRLDLPIVPKIIRYSDTPSYLVQTFLPGEHLSTQEFRKLPVDVQQLIGSQIAEFAYSLHSTLKVKEFATEYAKAKFQVSDDGTYNDYLREMLYDYTLPTTDQDKIAKQYFKAWSSIRPSKPVVVHDDLHIHNLLIQDGHLSGIVDFGAVCVGTAEQELRQVYRLSNEAFIAAVKTYNTLANTELDAEAARIWATTQELAAYARELKANRKHSPALERAQDHLALWFPGAF